MILTVYLVITSCFLLAELVGAAIVFAWITNDVGDITQVKTPVSPTTKKVSDYNLAIYQTCCGAEYETKTDVDPLSTRKA